MVSVGEHTAHQALCTSLIRLPSRFGAAPQSTQDMLSLHIVDCFRNMLLECSLRHEIRKHQSPSRIP